MVQDAQLLDITKISNLFQYKFLGGGSVEIGIFITHQITAIRIILQYGIKSTEKNLRT